MKQRATELSCCETRIILLILHTREDIKLKSEDAYDVSPMKLKHILTITVLDEKQEK